MQALIGLKKTQGQKFLENGMRIPVTLIDCTDNRVIAVMTQEKNKYQAIQLGFGITKKSNRARVGHSKGAGLETAPKFLREVRVNDDSPLPNVGDVLVPSEVFQPGDIVNVSGISKGKGFAGGVKRHGFHGGPKTHGQSDRHRAPGSVGQGTTPGRVYKGKKMAGRMGSDNVTVKNLKIVDVTDGNILIKGVVPGVIDNLIYIEKAGEDKKFVPLWKEAVEEVAAEAPAEEPKVEEASPVAEEKPTEEVKVESGDEQVKEDAATEVAPIENPAETPEETKEEVKEEENANS